MRAFRHRRVGPLAAKFQALPSILLMPSKWPNRPAEAFVGDSELAFARFIAAPFAVGAQPLSS